MKLNTIFIGNIAYDIDSFYYEEKEEKLTVKNKGGACLYSAIPASLFYRVGIVSKIGDDFDTSVFSEYDIDTKGLKVYKNEKTTCFHQIYKYKNQKIRQVEENINKNLVILEKDIPNEYLQANHIHITTNEPKIQLRLVKYIRKNSNAIISVDTINGYSKNETTKEVFNLVDIAFIDEEFTDLLDCTSKVKIIKKGANGCEYISENEKFFVDVNKINAVNKTGAGDCMNGVFINLISNGWSNKEALEKATKVATESIKDNGIEHLKTRTFLYKNNS